MLSSMSLLVHNYIRAEEKLPPASDVFLFLFMYVNKFIAFLFYKTSKSLGPLLNIVSGSRVKFSKGFRLGWASFPPDMNNGLGAL